MFGNKVEKATSKWPIDSVDPKKRRVAITGSYATPATQALVLLMCVGSFVPLVVLTGGMGLVFLIPGVPALWMLFKKNLRIRIDDDTIRVNGKRYERDPDFVQFHVDWHHRAHEGGVFGKALEVVMQYGERRIPVASMRLKDRQMADALAFRLQRWCKEFEKIMASYQTADAAQLRPESMAGNEFGPSPDVR